MKIVTVYEARSDFAEVLDRAQAEVMVVTRYGRPVAAVIGIDGHGFEGALAHDEEMLRRDLLALLSRGGPRHGRQRSRGR